MGYESFSKKSKIVLRGKRLTGTNYLMEDDGYVVVADSSV